MFLNETFGSDVCIMYELFGRHTLAVIVCAKILRIVRLPCLVLAASIQARAQSERNFGFRVVNGL